MGKINTGFKKFTDGGLSIKASFIITCMTGNANFTNPEPPLADVSAALTAFNEALADAKAGGKALTLVKNLKRADLETLLTRLGLWVQLHAEGDDEVLSSSGYDLAVKKTPVGVLPKPVNFTVKPAEGIGSTRCSMQPIVGADSYLFEYTSAPIADASIWTTISSSRASLVIPNLSSGSQYMFRAVGIGANPTKVYSDVIGSYVL